jgi:hypothetical protein
MSSFIPSIFRQFTLAPRSPGRQQNGSNPFQLQSASQLDAALPNDYTPLLELSSKLPKKAYSCDDLFSALTGTMQAGFDRDVLRALTLLAERRPDLLQEALDTVSQKNTPSQTPDDLATERPIKAAAEDYSNGNHFKNSTNTSLVPVIQFSCSIFYCHENDGIAPLTVVRAGDLRESVEVWYKTVQMSAKADVKYREVEEGKLVLEPGQTHGTFSIPILQDPFWDSTVEFGVELTQVVSKLGADINMDHKFARVKIIDADYFPSNWCQTLLHDCVYDDLSQ